LTNYSLRQIRYFIARVDCGGIAQASRSLNISQPSISVAIKELEVSFGMQLFVRRRASGMKLTPVGQRFYEHALRLHRGAREFEQKALGENNQIAGEISLACFETLAPLYAPSLIASFQKLFPGVTIKLHIAAQARIIHGLRTGAYDIAICYTRELPPGIENVALLPDLFPHAVLPKGHRLANVGPVSLSMLAFEPFILLDIWPSNEYFLSLFEAKGISPNVAYLAPSLEMVRGLVGHGLGFSLLTTEPTNTLTFDGKEVVTLPISDQTVPSTIAMAWHDATELTRTTREFLFHCQSTIRRPHNVPAPVPTDVAQGVPDFSSGGRLATAKRETARSSATSPLKVIK
jgi:DNA-binding transcriptional LysR family regulator